ncbi:MAG TPA: hypothetical protein VMC07_03000 [Candidatus Omnitrophota bacterium]|nr:hypothetical protein [Candidatus Omnitrophota bacterium]
MKDKLTSSAENTADRENHGSTLDTSTVMKLCGLRYDALKAVENLFIISGDAGDAKYLMNSWKRWIDGNWSSFIGGRKPAEERIRQDISAYSEYLA